MSREQREAVRSQFNRQAAAYAGNTLVADTGLATTLASAIGITPIDRVLDVACGPGFLTAAMAERAGFALGVDVTEGLLSRAREEGRRRDLANLGWLCADVERLALHDETFDVTTCKFAFHHFDSPGRVLAEMNRVTRPGGRLVIIDMVGSEDPETRALHDRIERWCDPTHAGALPRSEFARLFAAEGLTVERARTGESVERFSDWLAHAGPSADDTRSIEAEAERLLGVDLGGIRFSRDDEGLRLAHSGITYVLAKPSA